MTESVIQKLQKDIESRPKPLQKSYGRVYDILEQKDKLIKKKLKTINQIKQKTLSEFVYTNCRIPLQWKNKIDFQDNIAKLLAENDDLLCYLGHEVKQEENENAQKTPIKMDQKLCNKKFRPKSAKISPMAKIKKLKKENNCKNNSLINSNFNKISNLNSSVFSSSSNKAKSNLNKNRVKYTKEEIIDIFDELQNEFPIRNKFEELYPNYEEDIQKHKNLLKQSVNVENNKKSKKIKNVFLMNNKKHSLQRKLRIFNNNKFNNLVSASNSINKNQNSEKFTQSLIPNKKIHQNKKFISRMDSTDNKVNYSSIKIQNPTIFKLLKGVNFYGPYYSYCFPCADRNKDYYKRLEQNQCISILKSIKKEKSKEMRLNKTTTKI